MRAQVRAMAQNWTATEGLGGEADLSGEWLDEGDVREQSDVREEGIVQADRGAGWERATAFADVAGSQVHGVGEVISINDVPLAHLLYDSEFIRKTVEVVFTPFLRPGLGVV